MKFSFDRNKILFIFLFLIYYDLKTSLEHKISKLIKIHSQIEI